MPTDTPTRTRRRFRPILTLTLALVAMVVGWAGVEVYLAYTAKPAIKVNYAEKLRQLAEDWQDRTEPNAWPSLIEAVELHKEMIDSFRDEQTGWTWNTAYFQYESIGDYDYCVQSVHDGFLDSEYTRDEALKLLEMHRQWAFRTVNSFGDRGILDRLDTVSTSRSVIAPVPDSQDVESFIGESLVYGRECRYLARALHAVMRWSGGRGDWNRYTTSLEHCLAISRALMMQPSSSSWFTGVAIRDLATSKLRDDLVMGHIPPQVVGSIQEAYLRQAKLLPFRYTMEADRLTTLDTLQRLFTSSGRYIPSEFAVVTDAGTPSHWSNNLTSIAMPRWKTVEQRVNHMYDERIELISMPRWQRLSQPGYTSTTMMEAISPPTSLNDLISKSGDVWLYGNANDLFLAKEQGVAILLAIEHYAAEQGSYPESLQQLVPKYIAELPLDPYASEGVIWQYRLVTNSPRGERPYILYSVGIDGTDNGGAIREGESPSAALSLNMLTGEAPPIDYVVTAKDISP